MTAATRELTLGHKITYTAGLAAIFAAAMFTGEHPPSHALAVVRPGVIASGGFWLLASLIPFWRRTSVNMPALANSIAAASAVYAGLAALHPM